MPLGLGFGLGCYFRGSLIGGCGIVRHVFPCSSGVLGAVARRMISTLISS